LGVGIASGVDRFFALGGDVALLGFRQLLPSAVMSPLSSSLQKTGADTVAISASPCLLGRVSGPRRARLRHGGGNLGVVRASGSFARLGPVSLENDATDTEASDPETPAAGQAF